MCSRTVNQTQYVSCGEYNIMSAFHYRRCITIRFVIACLHSYTRGLRVDNPLHMDGCCHLRVKKWQHIQFSAVYFGPIYYLFHQKSHTSIKDFTVDNHKDSKFQKYLCTWLHKTPLRVNPRCGSSEDN